MWEAFGLLGVLALWGALGLLGHVAALIATRPRPVTSYAAPLAIVAAIAAALLVPALGPKNALAFTISLPLAVAAGFLASFVFALPATARRAQRAPR